MFDFIRNHQRLMQFILLLLILPSFALWGVQSYSRFHEGEQGLATVAGRPITQQEFDAAQRRQLEQLHARLGSDVDPKLIDSPEARAQVLQGLIGERLLLAQAAQDHLTVSNERVAAELRNDPSIRSLYRPDGTLDVARYDQLLAAVGKTRDSVFSETRSNIVLQEESSIIPDSSFAPSAVASRLDVLLRQVRDVQELKFSPADFRASVKLAPDASQKYYQAHASEFQVPEQIDAQYIVLDQNAILGSIQLKPEEIKAYYDQNIKRFAVPEERRASHILVAVAKDASSADREKAKAKAQEILARLRAHPSDFAKLARQYSDDPGSASKGGDLGWAPASNYVAPFADALFKLQPNQLSDVVQTDFGYHIIELTGVHGGSAKPLDSVRSDIELEMRQARAKTQFAESAETFSNMVYDQADSLTGAASKFGLTIQSASGVTRTPNAAHAHDPLENPKVLAALFSDDVLKNKHNTEAIEVAPDTLVAARVTAHKPASERPFSEVSDAIKSKLVDEQASDLAAAAGAVKLKSLMTGADDTGFGPVKSISRTNAVGLPPTAMKEIFRTNASKLPAYAGVSLPDGTFAIYRILKVSVPPSQDPAREKNLALQLAHASGELEFSGYLEGLKKKFKVRVLKAGAKPDSDGVPG